MRKRTILSILILINTILLEAQTNDTTGTQYLNTAEMLLRKDGKLLIGGYGEVHYNQPLTKGQQELGTLDVHRMVMFLGYNFSKKTQFVSEIEVENAKEVWVEQAFLQHKLNQYINLKAGLMLVPMGIINEYHEPTTFNGVERPTIDNRLSLSTWREVGFGLSGNVIPASIKYQLYLMGGLNGYDTKAVFNGANGLREGRQKGSKAYVSSPALSGKVEYYGIRNLNIGLSGYFGKSQSKLYGKLPDDNTTLEAKADSSAVGISMIGVDGRYRLGALELRGQVYYTALSNTEQYNRYTRSGTTNNDLGKTMFGYYAEAGYNVFRYISSINTELVPFVRYEFYDTHQSVDNITKENPNYKNNIITTGLTLRLTKQAVIKADMQFIKSASAEEYSKTFNAGIGVMF